MSKPVDVVYLWVNGDDPAWRKKRQRAHAQLGENQHAMAAYGNVEGRYRDNDELRYSLRALARFFPNHGQVYLVTDAQTPVWLRAHPQITVVDHRELIPASALPTFDSGHIESYIHRIPNLSERYFYCNDDVFFGAPVKLDDWFWPGGVYVGWSDEPEVSNEPLRMDATALENACRLSHQWLNAHPDAAGLDTPMLRTFAHSPRPMVKSVLFGLEKLASDLFASVRSTVFRTWDKPTIVSDFVLRWSLANGLAKARDYAHVHVSSGDLHGSAGLDEVIAQFGKLDFFCINDTTDDAHPGDPRLSLVRDALERLLPVPSRFEKATPDSGLPGNSMRHPLKRHVSHHGQQAQH
ncbi:MAG: Stealth CR1 domain-containing protein [Rhodoferax sp.]|nr:Stealth CR1 domain-containing protein [Rhodoferax sp.]